MDTTDDFLVRQIAASIIKNNPQLNEMLKRYNRLPAEEQERIAKETQAREDSIIYHEEDD